MSDQIEKAIENVSEPWKSKMRNYPVRWMVLCKDRDGNLRWMFESQGKNTYKNKKEAEQAAEQVVQNNAQEKLEQLYGKQVTGTIHAGEVLCYPNHFDPFAILLKE